jgi:hypothetical protein
MEPHEFHGNPNVCANCERLLEDESPSLMADAGSITRNASGPKQLDRPEGRHDAEPQRTPNVPAFDTATKKAEK